MSSLRRWIFLPASTRLGGAVHDMDGSLVCLLSVEAKPSFLGRIFGAERAYIHLANVAENGPLIAAAPRMFDALLAAQAALAQMHEYGWPVDVAAELEMVRSALHKARDGLQ